MEATKDDFLVECVVNISEGRNLKRLERITSVFNHTNDVKLLNVDTGHAANRSVLTILGPCTSLLVAIENLYLKSAEEINMVTHKGNHPRIGTVDVCPFIPLDKENTELLKQCVHKFAQEISKKIKAPVFLYAQSSIGEIKTLPSIRKGEYSRLIDQPDQMTFVPDFGKDYHNTRFGGTVIGVRDFMVAYNVNIETKDLVLAKQIAKDMRKIRDGAGVYGDKNIRPLQIMGWYIEEFSTCQISTNIHNPRELSMKNVYEFTREISGRYGVVTKSSELIGMIPQFALDMIQRSGDERVIVEALGLNFSGGFDLDTRVLERVYFLKR